MQTEPRIALVTGASRGTGAAVAKELTAAGYIVIGISRRAVQTQYDQPLQTPNEIRMYPCDMTSENDVKRLCQQLTAWGVTRLSAIALVAAGGMERELLARDQHYPMRINCQAQVAFVRALLPVTDAATVVTYVTSHLAHGYQELEQFIPGYEPIAESKWKGESALRELFATIDPRLLVVTGGLIEDSKAAQHLDALHPGLIERCRLQAGGKLLTVDQFASGIVTAMLQHPPKDVVEVGYSMASLPKRTNQP